MPASAGELRRYKTQSRRTRDIRLPPSISSADFFRATHSSTFRLTRDANPNSCVQFISCAASVGYKLIPKKGNYDFRRRFGGPEIRLGRSGIGEVRERRRPRCRRYEPPVRWRTSSGKLRFSETSWPTGNSVKQLRPRGKMPFDCAQDKSG